MCVCSYCLIVELSCDCIHSNKPAGMEVVLWVDPNKRLKVGCEGSKVCVCTCAYNKDPS